MTRRDPTEMPCPVCGHEQNDRAWYAMMYDPEGMVIRSGGIPCVLCGTSIRVAVPLHAVCAMPAGWRWERHLEPRALVQEHALLKLVAFGMHTCGPGSNHEIDWGSINSPGAPLWALAKALNALNENEVADVFKHPLTRVLGDSTFWAQVQIACAQFQGGTKAKPA